MIIIEEILISDAVTEEHFMCNLEACKGACCWEGDFGAPLEESEREIIKNNYSKIAPFLTDKSKNLIESEGFDEFIPERGFYATKLHSDGACAYLTFEENGIAQCGIEKAHNAGKTDFLKPISCHLYPIRVEKNPSLSFEALNYDIWDICSAACEKGKENKMPIYRFVKDALVRKYGQEFYDQLHQTVKDHKSEA